MWAQNILLKLFFRSFWTKLFLLSIGSSLIADSWASQTLNQLTLKEKIEQLFMMPVYCEPKRNNVEKTLKLLDNHSIGGIIFMQGDIESQRSAYTKLQQKSRLPLLVGQDNEWGLSMRLKDGLRFPRNLTLGALKNEKLIYDLGREIANQCRGVGVHVNFSPVIDINTNPKNPVISDRSFGENPFDVTRKGLLMMQGLQDGKILACAKHFPGHGDTEFDSHFNLPIINKSIEEFQKVEWLPFNELIQNGVGSIMMAHLFLPQISSEPTSVCQKTICNLLKEKLSFKGLIFTDGLQMKAITDKFSPGESELAALKAGNDVLLIPIDLEKAILTLHNAVLEGNLPESEIDEHVLKILQAKEQVKLNSQRELPSEDLFSKDALKLKEKLFKEAITLVHEKESLPLSRFKKYAFVQIGRDVIMKDALELVYAPYEEQKPKKLPPFISCLQKNLKGHAFFIPKASDEEFLAEVLKKLNEFDEIIVGVFEMNKYAQKNYGITPSTLSFFKKMAPKKVHICLFGSPYSLKYFKDQETILMAYENDEDAQEGAAEILLGKRQATGQLPIHLD